MNNPPQIDQSVQGKRVKLISIRDGLQIRPGDEGTVASWSMFDMGGMSHRTLQVEWDRGPDLSLIEGVDEWEWLSGEPPQPDAARPTDPPDATMGGAP